MIWLTANDALAALGVKAQTLYANVSRGRIRAKPDPQEPRRRLYHGEDVARLARRRAGRKATAAIAAETIKWGDPVLASSITTVADGRLCYRGKDAVMLSSSATLEHVADLLWESESTRFGSMSTRRTIDRRQHGPLRAALEILAKRVDSDLPSQGRSRSVLVAEGSALIDEIATAMLGVEKAGRPSMHQRMADAWKAPRAEDLMRRALVLLADHELNASTFASRVAVSTGAPLSAGLMAGLATLAGPLHGGASASLQVLADSAKRIGAQEALREWLAQGRPLAAFGHPLYPEGDPRAAALLGSFTPRQTYIEISETVHAITGEYPNVDFAISALGDRFALPPSAPFVIFALARSVGWIAHVIEQSLTGQLIRPRARYEGPKLDLDLNNANISLTSSLHETQ